MSNTLKM